MVTFIYILVFAGLILLLSFLDMLVYKEPFIQSLLALYSFDIGTRRTIVAVPAILGLFICVLTDYRLHKQKKNNKSSPKKVNV
ncbi:hypothetical protein BKP45_08435 [Anaerobacillus alkalidiazotrophicus]|uniref:Uncharacterized protein n=1 Tax=Anaerobacillus alkalidiazotrophicus TaxID=472963 RepID=A0A1S2M819_9BACI|nr:hypothetical protein [Anaerobacillus alkalidiazotrophicus]OIJ20811.1 hypothetical protein BKP45_08435 [Anaerobacillus alkalidiazotrophicus]